MCHQVSHFPFWTSPLPHRILSRKKENISYKYTCKMMCQELCGDQWLFFIRSIFIWFFCFVLYLFLLGHMMWYFKGVQHDFMYMYTYSEMITIINLMITQSSYTYHFFCMRWKHLRCIWNVEETSLSLCSPFILPIIYFPVDVLFSSWNNLEHRNSE